MAPPVWRRDENLTRAFLEAAAHLAGTPPNAVYAAVCFRSGVSRAMGDRFLAPDDYAMLEAVKRCDEPERAFAALGGRSWMPARVRAMAEDPERWLNELFSR